jgi:histidinol-phosphate aminotransferase
MTTTLSAGAVDPRALVRPEVMDLEEYIPIQPFEVLSKRLGVPAHQIVKLDANENPYGPLPAVAEALAEYGYYHIYPDPQQTELREALSGYAGVPPVNILPTHGADELLDTLCRVFLAPGDMVINCPPTFGMYRFDAGLAGGRVRDVWRTPEHHVDVAAVEAEVHASMATGAHQGRPKILFLTAPNNPSGTWLPDDELRRLLALPVLVVLDEAYIEFAHRPSRASWVLEHENLVVARTFSKAAGIAGLRLGYGICPTWLMELLWKFKQPYNVNVAATVAGLASLRHVDEMRAVVARLRAERDRLYDLLAGVPFLRPWPSDANFILCDVRGRDAKALKLALERQGILVRYYNSPGLQNCIRVSVGRPEHTDRLIAALNDLAT